MSRNARQSQTGVNAHDGSRIGVTDSARFDPNPDLTCSRLGDLPLHYSELARFRDFHCFVCTCHLYEPPVHFVWLMTIIHHRGLDSRTRDLVTAFFSRTKWAIPRLKKRRIISVSLLSLQSGSGKGGLPESALQN